jgi:hypothetical protein
LARDLFSYRDFTDQSRAAPGSGLDLQVSSKGVGPVAHDVQAEAFSPFSGPKTFPVVFHHQSDQVAFALDADDNLGCARVRQRVAKGFLRDSVKVDRNVFIPKPNGTRQFQMAMNVRPLVSLLA